MAPDPFDPPSPQRLTADLRFRRANCKTPFTVGDFWAWAFSDLRLNDLRGILAEYIVAKALDIPLTVRETWANYDLLGSDGTRIEVKGAGYLQAWRQPGLSQIKFSELRGREQIQDETGVWVTGEAKIVRADVYVFCVQTARTHEDYDPFDIAQWAFHVAPGRDIAQDSIAHSVVRSRWPEIDFDGLKEAVAHAARQISNGMKHE